jgi:hypothetical protein
VKKEVDSKEALKLEDDLESDLGVNSGINSEEKEIKEEGSKR